MLDVTVEMIEDFEKSVFVKKEDFDNYKGSSFYVNKEKMKTFVVNENFQIIGCYPIEIAKECGLENDLIIEILTLKKDEILRFLSKNQ